MMKTGREEYRIGVCLRDDIEDVSTKWLDCSGTESSVWIKFNKSAQNSDNDSPHPSLSFKYDEIGVDLDRAGVTTHRTAEVIVMSKDTLGPLGKAVYQFNIQPNAGPRVSHLRLRLYCRRCYNGSIDLTIQYFPSKNVAVKFSFSKCMELGAPVLRNKRKSSSYRRAVSRPLLLLVCFFLFFLVAVLCAGLAAPLIRPDDGILEQLKKNHNHSTALLHCDMSKPQWTIEDDDINGVSDASDVLYFLSVSLSTAGYGNVTPLQSGACFAAFFATLLGICVVSVFVSVLSQLVDGKGSDARSCSLCKSRRRFAEPTVVPVEAARVAENNKRGSDTNNNELASRAGSRPGLSVRMMCILENLAIFLALLTMIGLGTIIYHYDLKNSGDVSPSFARCLLFGVLSATTLGSSSEGPTTPEVRVVASLYLPIALMVTCTALYTWISMAHRRKPVGLEWLCYRCCGQLSKKHHMHGWQAKPPSEAETQMLSDFDKLTTDRPQNSIFAQPEFMARHDEQLAHGQREQFILRMLLRYNKLKPHEYNCLADQFRLLTTHTTSPRANARLHRQNSLVGDNITSNTVEKLSKHMGKLNVPLN